MTDVRQLKANPPRPIKKQGEQDVTQGLKQRLTYLADKYETEDFLQDDPSQFMHRYTLPVEQERAAFIAAALSYGSRKQFLPKIERLIEMYNEEPFPCHGGTRKPYSDETCFYRLHNYGMVRRFLKTLQRIEKEYGSLGQMMEKGNVHTGFDAIKTITDYFSRYNASDLIPKDCTSSCKRICMFLRWMVRDNSPVDLGLWSHFIDKKTLIMPLDTHVLQEAQQLGLISSRSATMVSAKRLTDRMRKFFPDDPVRGDFALFGLGVDKDV